MKTFIYLFSIIFFLGLFSPSLAQITKKLPLNGSWKFKIDPYSQGEDSGWFVDESKSPNWDEMDVPGNWDVKNEYAHYTGKAWYQKTFEVPSNWKNKNIKIHFEAVSHNATVWINGKMIGANDSGFLPFDFDIAPFILPGQVNSVTVLADNSKKIGAIWNWGGIRRSVHLSVSDGIRLTGNYVTPIYDYKEESAIVNFRLKFKNYHSQGKVVKGTIQVKKDGLLIKNLPFFHQAESNAENEILLSTRLEGKEVKAWHFDAPYLYDFQIIFMDSDIPNEEGRFGLRKVELDESKKQLLLNGEPIRAMGFNLVPDDRTAGNTLPLWRIKEDIDLIKEAGGNLARLSHLPLPKEALDYMDERGIMTFSEIPLWGFDPLADPNSKVSENWLKRLIDSQYNHPSIIGWSVGNEIGDYPETYEYVKKAIYHTKTLDSTRLATAVSHTAHRSSDFLLFSDLGLINKYGTNLLGSTESQHKNFPDKTLFYSEYGTGQIGEDINSDLDAKGLLEPLRNLDYLIGASLWTFNDYRSNYFGTKEYSENRSWGVVDVFRRKKRAYFSIKNEHAPVRDFKIARKSQKSVMVTFSPRRILDLPSYILRDYKLVWQLEDLEGKILEAGWEILPEIRQATNSLERNIAWKTEGVHKLQVMLLTPQNDNVSDAVLYFESPKLIPPLGVFGGRMLQNDIGSNSAKIRVFLDENGTSDYHFAKIKNNLDVKEVGPIYENHLDISGLKFSTPYDLEVFAVNSAGETSILNQKIEIEPKKVVPPAIRQIETTKTGFYVGYATEVDDFQFRVRYSKGKNLENNSKTITTTNPGLIYIPVEDTDQPYYFQIQRVKDNNYFSDWSMVFEVPFDEILKPQVSAIKSVVRQKGGALVHFEPVKKAIGYVLEYRKSGEKSGLWSAISLSRSIAELVFVEGLNPKTEYEFRLSTRTLDGITDYSEVIRK